MSFVATTISNDGTNSVIVGNGDPTANSITPATGNAVFLCTDTSASDLIFGWDSGESAWIGQSRIG